MRKNVIALMLVLPLLFMVVFSQMMNVPLGATPTVTSVKIRNKPSGGTQTVELLDYDDSYTFAVDVYPQAAAQELTVSYEQQDGTPYAEGEEPVEALPVEGEKNTFRVVADSVGQTVIRVTSKEGNLSDSFSFNVVSSRAYDYTFSLAKGEDAVPLTRVDDNTYRGTVEPGTYTYATVMLPVGTSFAIPRISDTEGEAVVDEASSRIKLCFADTSVRFKVYVPGLPEETATKTVELDVRFPASGAPTAKPILVDGDGVGDAPIEYTLGRLEDDAAALTSNLTVRIQTWYGAFTCDAGDGISVEGVEEVPSETYHNYRLKLLFTDTTTYREPTLTLTFPLEGGGTDTVTLKFSFVTFSFKLRANINETTKYFENKQGEAIPGQALLLNAEISFSAVPDSPADGIVYLWDLLTEYGAVMDAKEYASLGGLPLDLVYGEGANRSICTVRAVSKISRVILRVRAAHIVDGVAVPYDSLEPLRIAVEVMENILSLELVESKDAAQAARSDGKILTVAGNHYENDGGLKLVSDPAYTVDIRAAKSSTGGAGGVVDTDTTVDIRNLQLGTVTVRRTGEDGTAVTKKLTASELEGEGLRLGFANTQDPVTQRVKQQLVIEMRNIWQAAEVTIPVEWSGNESFGREVRVNLTLNLIKNAVTVTTSDQVFEAAEHSNYAIVLGADIMLGTSAAGAVLPIETRRSMLKSMYSTYNTEYYRGMGQASAAYVRYVLEFKNSVYGNGYFLNAEHFTNAKDGTGLPVLFTGPLDFVRLAGIASVAAQDNIAYLCRTDGVTLYNTVLLGCSDESLLEADGSYNLIKLNNTGTTLEINADVNVLNCRIRNGRNVVRIYGGNRDASEQFGSYFIGSLDRHQGCDDMRIHVRIEGCVISYAREFLIKMGSNLALHAGANLGAEPDLTDSTGKPYAPDPEGHLDDDYFYSRYVINDVTLKDSVLDTSGLFSVGVESNFAGPILRAETGFDFGGVLEGAGSWPGTGGTSFASVLRLSGDVRMYDWKELGRIDSSTLIQVVEGNGFGDLLRLNIASMLRFVRDTKEGFGNIIDSEDHVHGGIAFYGGGKNYAQLDRSELTDARNEFSRYEINIDVLAESPDPNIQRQGQYLPLAAGTQPFRFYMYDRTSAHNSYDMQMSGADKSVKSVLAF